MFFTHKIWLMMNTKHSLLSTFHPNSPHEGDYSAPYVLHQDYFFEEVCKVSTNSSIHFNHRRLWENDSTSRPQQGMLQGGAYTDWQVSNHDVVGSQTVFLFCRTAKRCQSKCGAQDYFIHMEFIVVLFTVKHQQAWLYWIKAQQKSRKRQKATFIPFFKPF